MAVPLLVTVDVEVASDHDERQQEQALHDLQERFDELGLRSTFFTTAGAARRHPAALRAVAAGGAEIGCHGLHHTPEEDYRRFPPRLARRYVEDATSRVAAACGVRPVAFRAPRMAVGPTAHAALVEAGYLADFSVCPQRLDAGSSPGATRAALRAPRAPYRPAAGSPHRRGALPLWEVPLSGIGAPFLSGTLYSAPPVLMRAMLRLLVREARASGGAVVFLCHSYELADRLGGPAPKLSQRRYGPTAERRRRLWAFLHDLATAPGVEPMTASDLVRRLDDQERHELQAGHQDPLPRPADAAVPDPVRERRLLDEVPPLLVQ